MGGPEEAAAPAALPLREKLNAISIPVVSFTSVELNRVVSALGALAEEFDPSEGKPKGVNLVLLDPANANPIVTITLRNLTLKRILDFVTDAVGFQYEIEADAVVLRPGGERFPLGTEVFPVSRATVIRMTGQGGGADTRGNRSLEAAPDGNACAVDHDRDDEEHYPEADQGLCVERLRSFVEFVRNDARKRESRREDGPADLRRVPDDHGHGDRLADRTTQTEQDRSQQARSPDR